MTRPIHWQKACALAAGILLSCGVGCQSLMSNPFKREPDMSVADRVAADDIDPENGVVLADGNEGFFDKTKNSSNRLVGYVTGREPENLARGKELYKEADALFRQGSYKAAAKLFHRAGDAAPKTALQQDAMFMEGESLFFADKLTSAAKVYEKLQKDFPRNRHNDKVAARLFSISRYWIDTEKAREDSWRPGLNLTDSKRPWLDTDGHAIRLLDQIRYDDPTGRLADDATMAAAAEYIRQEKFEEADEFLTDLREAFPDSDHLFLAHLLGIRCKLNIYAGARYSGLVLEEADKLVKQTRTRFPDRLRDPKYREMVARAAAEISYLRGERLVYRARYREKRHEYGAARFYYNEILTDYADTPFAEEARERLAATEGLAPVPTQYLSWLTKVFPDTRSNTPLEFNGGVTNGGETKLR